MESIYIQWQHDHILITNPGGFPEGITAENILVHEPKLRNTWLAEAFKRIGITDQTGRRVDKIYMGQVRYGRPPPDYSRSDNAAVRVVIPGGESSLDFAAFIFEEERNGKIFSLDDLLVLNELYYDRQMDAPTAGKLIQKGTAESRRVLEHLHELGLVEGRGERGGRVYHLPASLYKRFHMKAEYVRSKGFEPLQQEQMIIEYVKEHGIIRRAEVADLCKISDDQVKRLLKSNSEKHEEFKMVGARRGAHYIWEGCMERAIFP
ncbi:MAG: ATP-binding protein [Methanoregula sp.]|nr:ATP-binding protein [Methanoregula sp.]